MNPINGAFLKLLLYISSKRQGKLCTKCNKGVYPKREISILNILFYTIIGIIVYLITGEKTSLLIPIVLSIVNTMIAKPKCPICKSTELQKI